jgi:hypothetical protein
MISSSSNMTFAEKVLQFYSSLHIQGRLPKGVGVLNPYANSETLNLCKLFYHKYYNDTKPRTIILGINPGRFGAGLTGIPFMDPLKLETICEIKNDFPKKTELSADFINAMIVEFGGHQNFYEKLYINSVSPLGFVQDGKNLNYYDTPALQKSVEPFIINSITQQLTFGINQKIAFCLGEGSNFKYLSRLNSVHQWFDEIIPLAHPRFIMQYKRKSVTKYIEDYVKKLNTVFG